MGKKCLKCGYERKELEVAPAYECPSCGAIYAKVEKALERKQRLAPQANTQNQARFRLKPRRLIAVAVAVGSLVIGTIAALLIYQPPEQEPALSDQVREKILRYAPPSPHQLVWQCGIARSPLSCKVMIEAGIDINSLDEYGNGALHKLTDRYSTHDTKDVQMLKLLLENGADPNLRNGDGDTPLDLLLPVFPLSRDSDINIDNLSALLKGGAHPTPTSLVGAAEEGSLEAVALLRQYGATDQEARRKGKTSALIAAADSPSIVNYLIAQGVDVNYQTNDGYSALHSAALSGEYESVLSLLNAGANVRHIYTGEGAPMSVCDTCLSGLHAMGSLALMGVAAGANTLLHEFRGDERLKTLELLEERGCAFIRYAPGTQEGRKMMAQLSLMTSAAAEPNQVNAEANRSIRSGSCLKREYFEETPHEIRWANDNAEGTACFDAVEDVRELGNHPEFDCNSAIQKKWSDAVDRASSLGCKL